MKFQKPFLKWVGGKTQIIEKVICKFPRKIENYHEIFLGGGSVLLALLTSEDIEISGSIFCYDYNEALIYTYKNIQNNSVKLVEEIQEILEEFSNIPDIGVINRKPIDINEAKVCKENYYYWLRKNFNSCEDKKDLHCSVLFIILNKLTFRGMYREGPNGFNVPYGNYKKIPSITKEIIDVSKLIGNVVFIHSDFRDSIKNIKANDFVYFDPPYFDTFSGYNNKGFSLKDHESLFSMIKGLNSKFLLSNSCKEYVLSTFRDFKIEKIQIKRQINSKNPGSKTIELLISD